MSVTNEQVWLAAYQAAIGGFVQGEKPANFLGEREPQRLQMVQAAALIANSALEEYAKHPRASG